jgi:hypothetical protein
MFRSMLLLTLVLLLIGCAGQATEQVAGPATPTGGEAGFQVLVQRLLARRYAGTPAPEEVQLLVGQLPAELPIEIPLPDDAWVVGSLVHSGVETEIVLDASQMTDQVLDFYREALTAEGWVAFDYPMQGGFAPGIGRTGLTFCSETQDLVLWVGAYQMEDGSTDVRLDLRTEPRLASCTKDPGTPEHPIPFLEDPPGAQQITTGFGSSTDGFSAEVTLRTDLDAAVLEAHYAAQLEGAGWIRSDGAPARPLVWSAWTFQDEGGRDWQGLLLAMEMAEVPDRGFVYLRVDLAP